MLDKEKRFETIYSQGTMLSILVDTETGINYLFYNGGLTPVLDSNGKVVASEKEHNEK